MDYSTDQIKKIAYAGKELPPPSLPPPERIMWYAFRDLYARFKQKQITKEESEKEAAIIMRTYRDDRGIFDETAKIWKYHAELWKNIEVAGNAFARERTIETAERFYEAVYDVKLKQQTRKEAADIGRISP